MLGIGSGWTKGSLCVLKLPNDFRATGYQSSPIYLRRA